LKDYNDIVADLGNRSIFLAGFMGTGKTTTGYKLAQTLRIPFYDLDITIEDNHNIVIHKYFLESGEDTFRELESLVLEKLLMEPRPNVIALGGGTLLSEVNRAKLRPAGIVIGLKAGAIHIARRLNESQLATLMNMTGRPISDAIFTDKVIEAAKDLIKQRESLYDDVDFSVHTGMKNVSGVVEEIIEKLSDILI
jgi:shikimate kinase